MAEEDQKSDPNEVEGADNTAPDGVGAEPFLKPRLTGTRFKGHSIPLEFLKDLAVLEEMVIEVAKWQFLKANPGRLRSPRGFTDGVSLVLTGVEDGSAIPVISLVMASTTLFPPDNQIYFTDARDTIVRVIGAAEHNTAILDNFPERALSYFDRMGLSLRDGEAIEFTSNKEHTPVRLTKESRRRLVLASTQAQSVTEEMTERGVVSEVDKDNKTFEIRLSNGHKVQAPMSEPHRDSILEAFKGYEQGLRVILQGIGKYNRSNRLEKIESIEHISVLDPLDVASRLDELRGLKDGWLEGIGRAPNENGLDWLTAKFEMWFPEDLFLPYLYPTETGGVRAEWTLKNFEASIEFDLDAKVGMWHLLNMETDEGDDRTLSLDQQADWDWVVNQIRKLVGDAE